MAIEESPGRWARPPEVTVISITVVEPPRGRSRPSRDRLPRLMVRHRALAVVTTTLAVAALAAIVTTGLWLGEPTRSTASLRSAPLPPGQRAEIASALGYPYPLRCLTITVSVSDPDYARADIDHTNGCGRYHGYMNASFHRVQGAWRLMLDEGQLFVPNSLLSPCRAGRSGCARPAG